MDNYLPLSLSGVRKQNTDNRSYSRNPIPRLRLKLSTKTMWTNFCFEMYTKRTCLMKDESVFVFQVGLLRIKVSDENKNSQRLSKHFEVVFYKMVNFALSLLRIK